MTSQSILIISAVDKQIIIQRQMYTNILLTIYLLYLPGSIMSSTGPSVRSFVRPSVRSCVT